MVTVIQLVIQWVECTKSEGWVLRRVELIEHFRDVVPSFGREGRVTSAPAVRPYKGGREGLSKGINYLPNL